MEDARPRTTAITTITTTHAFLPLFLTAARRRARPALFCSSLFSSPLDLFFPLIYATVDGNVQSIASRK